MSFRILLDEELDKIAGMIHVSRATLLFRLREESRMKVLNAPQLKLILKVMDARRCSPPLLTCIIVFIPHRSSRPFFATSGLSFLAPKAL